MRSMNLGDAETRVDELFLPVSHQCFQVCFLVRVGMWLSVQEGGGLFLSFCGLQTEGPSKGNSGLYKPDGTSGLGGILGLTAKQ